MAGLWDTSAPNKANIHMWRFTRNGLAVGGELHRRRIKPRTFCVACGHEETIYHRFSACRPATLFWKVIILEKGAPVAIPPLSVGSRSALSNWMLTWPGDASEEEKAMMIHGL